MPTLGPTTDATSSWEVVSSFETRLVAALRVAGKPHAGFVRIAGFPDTSEGGGYKAEEGIHLNVGNPQPHKDDGASRYGKRVKRVIEVWLVTVCNQDRAGEQRIAAERHLNLQDVLFDAMDDTPPADVATTTWNLPVGVTLKWIPGGDEIRRSKKIDPSRFVSVHLFEIVYVQKKQVKK